MLHEAMQLALKGSKVFVSCKDNTHGHELAKNTITATASIFLLIEHPQFCNHSPFGIGWSVKYRNNNGEIFFSNSEPTKSDYFDNFFVFAPYWELVCAELEDKGKLQEPEPKWVIDTSLVREPVYVPTRYERIMARW